MDGLHFKYNEYMRLDQCTVEYTFSDGSSVSVRFTESGFLHLLVLHKLVDIQDIQADCRPAPELCSNGGFDSVAKRDDHVEVVMIYSI